METPSNEPTEQLYEGNISKVDYLNDLADQWRLQGYTEQEIAQGVISEEQRIDNLYFNLKK